MSKAFREGEGVVLWGDVPWEGDGAGFEKGGVEDVE